MTAHLVEQAKPMPNKNSRTVTVLMAAQLIQPPDANRVAFLAPDNLALLKNEPRIIPNFWSSPLSFIIKLAKLLKNLGDIRHKTLTFGGVARIR